LLWHSPEAYGFPSEFWTCDRVADILWEEFVASYSWSQVSRILKRLGWTPQIPITRAIQRDEKAIERWRVQSWPALREKARRERRVLVFVDESGFYLLPGVVKTYRPKGQTTVVDDWQTRDHLSVMGGVTPNGKVYCLVRRTSLNGLHRIEFLMHLGRLAGDRLLVIWGGSPIHRRVSSTWWMGMCSAAAWSRSTRSQKAFRLPWIAWEQARCSEVEVTSNLTAAGLAASMTVAPLHSGRLLVS
jgi:hypothetical protein